MKLTSTIIFILLISVTVKSQSGFTRNISIPVNDNGPLPLAWAGGINFPLFSEIDLNNDNIPDLFVFDRSNNRVMTFINNGNPGTDCWVYAPQYADLFPEMKGWARLYDYNCDNKPDLFCTNFRNNGISQYRNDSQSGNLVFTLVDSTIRYKYGVSSTSNILASSYLTTDLNDIDGDGDMDILGQQFQCVGGYAFYKNMSLEDYGTCDSLNDFRLQQNVWGDFSLRSGLYQNVVVGFDSLICQLYSPTNGNQGSLPYEVARRDDTYANIFTIDIDGDGDKDAIIGDSQAFNSLLVINGGDTAHAFIVAEDTLFPSYDVPVHINSFSAHAYVDADNDGIKDLIVSQSEYENKNGVYFYKNNGTNAIPHFNYILNNFLQSKMIDVGESATPVLFDYNADGLKDLIVGNRYLTTTDTTHTTGLTLYKNTGTVSSPAFEFITNDYASIQSLNLTGQIFPAFGDLDNDGDLDMILGNDDGHLTYFMNTAGPGVPAVFANPVYNYMSIDVGQASTPQLFDLNQDSKPDLVIGCKNGIIKYYENSGSVSTPFFPATATNDTLGNIIVQTIQSVDGYSVPFLFDQGGDTRILVSSMQGDIFLYGNIDGNISGNFTLLDTVFHKTGGSRYGYNISVSGGDLNNDTLMDMVLGYYGGGLQIFYQDFPTSVNPVSGNMDDWIRISPVPVSETLVIKSMLQTGITTCTLMDITGRQLFSKPIRGNYTTIDVSSFAEGTYLLRATNGNKVVTKKIIVER